MSQENKALAGMIGPAMFALIIVVLTLVQYDFMVQLGRHPIRRSDVPWPSGLALGPLGGLQVANFVLFGFMLRWVQPVSATASASVAAGVL